MIKTNIIYNNNVWKSYFKNPEFYVQKKIEIINKKFKRFNKTTLFCTILLSGDKEIRELNKKFRKKNKTTDILSFPFHKKKELKKKLLKEKEVYLGDIIINLNKIKDKKNKIRFKTEFNKLWIHGLTHLLGYDHKKDKDFYIMRTLEKKFLSYIN
tara:strand:+ start:199 stop:663 length:465 start_codon:yes stop_codon:yes gene_type:complete